MQIMMESLVCLQLSLVFIYPCFAFIFYQIDQREFLIGFALTSNGSIREKLKYVFRTYDHDKDGVINKKEIDRMVKVSKDYSFGGKLFLFDSFYFKLKIAIRLHAKGDPENTSRIIDELRRSLEHLNQGKDLDDIRITSKEFIQLLIENKDLCELVSPFNIEQPREVIVQQPHAQSK